MRAYVLTVLILPGLLGSALLGPVAARVYDLARDFGAVEGVDSLEVSLVNAAAFNASLALAREGDVVRLPRGTWHCMGGIVAAGKRGLTLSIDGTIVVSGNIKHWPRRGEGPNSRVMEFFEFTDMVDFTITSSQTASPGARGANAGRDGIGMIDGNGPKWWGIPGIGYLLRGENRPRLLRIRKSTNVKVERIFFRNPPYWTTFMHANGLEVRDCKIEAWRVSRTSHSIIDMTAFNTDGFDVSGNNIWIHDCSVWNQDDSFCIKDNTTNVVIENINASGIGLTIGSIASRVDNITFRNANMFHTYKGIYMKFRGAGTISNVLYENIVMDEPEQYPIWIGPAQQSDTSDLCAAHPCSICWPDVPFSKCDAPKDAHYINVTLRDITVNHPKGNPGVILANDDSEIQNVTFDNVIVNHLSTHKTKWGTNYYCKGVKRGVARGGTYPVPPCFEDQTRSAAK